MVDSVRAYGGVFHPGVPNVACPDQARRAHVAHGVSVPFALAWFFIFHFCVRFCCVAYKVTLPGNVGSAEC